MTTSYSFKPISTLSIIMFTMTLLTSCGGSSSSSGDGTSTSRILVFTPSQPGSAFTRAQTNEEFNDLVNSIWNYLIVPNCWDSTFVGDPTIAGTPAGVAQYQFHSNYQYRHVGTFDISFGTIILHDVGYYDGLETAILETWTGDIEAIVITGNNQFVHVLTNPSGVPFNTTYSASQGACL